jgi:predicted  nucleic acid-binding Zn-ribbon protein
MSDLVDRLRRLAETRRRSHSVAPEVLQEAADEIVALRAEVRRLVEAECETANMDGQVESLRARVRELTERNARLQSKIQETEVREI